MIKIKGLYFDSKLKYSENISKPVPGAGEALIEIKLASVCNTDLEIIKGYKSFQGILGHEFVGIVREAETENLKGKRVVGDINIGCNQCSMCYKGLPNHCTNRKILGMSDKNGAFADYITLPEKNLYIVPDNVTDYEAVLAEPLAAALQIPELCHIKPTDKVVVLGDGKLGYLITQVLANTACDLKVVGKHSNKLKRFERYSKVALINDLEEAACYDMVVDSTGNEQGLKLAQKLVKPRGTIVLKSTYSSVAAFNPSDWVVNEINIVGSRCGPLDGALRLLAKKYIDVENILDNPCSLKHYKAVLFSKQDSKPVFDLTKDSV
ncbi:MDR/zinc-dependent alcohol dehydrogenase-like family protein [Natranaerobius thermophilus]|uniref:Alcohol dehydrogenase GroES domain protein n=1 Tax=Natranaerobius thermophilus (strain ATCC BAA-1301 / DSM 18059 / JW/NM-WN-LF) TaxID=457570 RepID=B2A8B2_NATTJ|nr:alcohol dehydrogenase catalytic domain-containing protein [Natranaerobius thermophilus]ACB84478.1 Alcohol dehydrogenase GroES domain protein [Natranaerobius thermophilus JW/NM-WN-LF]